jgi:serine/threonine-protein kinase
VLGCDTIGVVWHGRIRATGASVAVRLAQIGPQADPQIVADLVGEREVLSSVRHPALLAVYDLGVEDDTVGLVTELLPGGPSLGEQLAMRGPIAPAAAATMAADLADALAAIHAADLVHGGVNARNILGSADGRARLLDLATVRLARRLIPRAGPRHAPAYDVPAYDAPAYAAPELIVSQRRIAATDVYALGIALYEMLTGVTPYEGGDADAVLRRHLEAEPVLPPGVPSGLRYVVGRCLHHDSSGRPAATAVAADLRQLATQLLEIPPAERPRGVIPRYRPAGRYRRALEAPPSKHQDLTHVSAAHAVRALPPGGSPVLAGEIEPAERLAAVTSSEATRPVVLAGRSEVQARPHRPDAPVPGAVRSRRRALRPAVAVLLLLALVGGAMFATLDRVGSDRVAPNNGSSPTVSPSPERTPAPPTLAATGTRRTPEGATAFVSYWFQTLTHAVATGDTGGLAGASSQGCEQCQAAIASISRSYAGGGSLDGGAYVVRSVIASGLPTGGDAALDVVFDRGPRSTVGPGGEVRGQLPGVTFAVCRALLDWSGGQWRMLTIASPTPLA